MIYPESFDKKIGFSVIRSMISESCLCSLGRQHAESISFLTSFEDIDLRLRQTDEFRHILLFNNDFPVDNVTDVTPSLKKLRVEGSFMEVHELFALKQSLDTARSMINWFSGKNGELYPTLKNLSGSANVPGFVRDRLTALLTREGKIKDNASPELQTIRRDIGLKQSAVSKKIHAVMKSAQSAGISASDASVSVRDGRLVIPVNASSKRKIKGFVLDESSTGKTVYIEPVEVVELNNELKELEFAERREILSILREFSASLVPYLNQLFEIFKFVGLIDFIRAKALFARKTGSVKPVLQQEPLLKWIKAIHPLLFLNLKKEGREVVPLDIELNEQNRILLISGPNAGGKSVCLQTAGLLQYMLQCGLLIPVSENSEAGLFSGIFIDIGDEQSIENDLSTYSSHLLNMKFFLQNSNSSTLILIDEFGAGTEPMLGGSIAEAILEQLNENMCYGVITTHYTNLKHYAASVNGIVNGAMLYDTGKMEPLFKLETGKPGSSFAFEIARKIGLSEKILEIASNKVGAGHIEFDKHLKDIIRDKNYWERKRKNIRQLEKKLEEDLESYTVQLEKAEKAKKEIISGAKAEARQLLETVNKQIENTIKEIKEAQAEREKTKFAREKIDNLKKEVEKSYESNSDIAQKMERLKAKKLRLEKRKEEGLVKKPKVSPVKKGVDDDVIRKGDYIKVKGREVTGEVMEAGSKTCRIAIGNMITSISINKIEKLSRNESKTLLKSFQKSSSLKGFNIGDRKLNYKNEIDLRGYRADDALSEVSLFIDESIMVGAGEVRILHGKGNGILRQLIREFLATVPVVKSFRDEHVERGGAGITVVALDN